MTGEPLQPAKSPQPALAKCALCGFLGAHRAGCAGSGGRADTATLVKRRQNPRSVPGATAYMTAGVLTFLLGAALMVGLAGVVAKALGRNSRIAQWLLVAGLAGVWYYAQILFRRGRAMIRRPVDELLAEPGRPIVLYLRSFADDLSTDLETPLPMLTNVAWQPMVSDEEAIVKVLGRAGSVVAIGNPSEADAPLGAYRVYVGDDGWRQRVRELLDHARLVVLRPGASAGLRWEWELLCRCADPRKVLVYFTWKGYRATRYQQFTDDANKHLPSPLSETMQGDCLVFDEDWSASWRSGLRAAMHSRGAGPTDAELWKQARRKAWLGGVAMVIMVPLLMVALLVVLALLVLLLKLFGGWDLDNDWLGGVLVCGGGLTAMLSLYWLVPATQRREFALLKRQWRGPDA